MSEVAHSRDFLKVARNKEQTKSINLVTIMVSKIQTAISKDQTKFHIEEDQTTEAQVKEPATRNSATVVTETTRTKSIALDKRMETTRDSTMVATVVGIEATRTKSTVLDKTIRNSAM